MVWTIPSPSPGARGLGAARLVSTPSRGVPSGLGSGLPLQVSPNLSSSASPVSRRALKFRLSPLRLPFRHARVAWLIASIKQARSNFTRPVSVACFWVCFFFGLGSHDVDRGGVEAGLDVRGIVFLDHLDAGAAVLGDLVDVRPFHQAQADIGVAQAVGRAGLAFAVDLEIFFLQDRVEQLALPFREDQVRRLRQASIPVVRQGVRLFPSRLGRARTEPGLQPLERADGAGMLLQ